MNKLKNTIGMTMAELLIVVGIIAILSGVSFVAVQNYQRSLGQLERDGIAKEIFVAAQNHLTAAFGEGYLGLGATGFGAEEDASNSIFYVDNSKLSDNSVLGQMLPFGSIDETVRTGGRYIIRYQKDTGTVLDVFYCTTDGSPTQYNYPLAADDDYNEAINSRDTDGSNKMHRRNWKDGSILGWYGGDAAATLPTMTLATPTIEVVNAEKLYVSVTNTNYKNSLAFLKLIITGVDSGAKKAYDLKVKTGEENKIDPARVIINQDQNVYTVILDDVTRSRLHFVEIEADTKNKVFIPGEDITIQAVAYSTEALANVAYSSKYTTNSLFGSINTAKNTAYIDNIRHLENLDQGISKLNPNDSTIKIANAEQTDSFSWIGFQKANKIIETRSTTGTGSDADYRLVGIFDIENKSTVIDNVGYYRPIAPYYELTYDGKNRSISDVEVKITGDGGLFGNIVEIEETPGTKKPTVSKIKDLELIDFSITGTTSAGALAGTMNGCTVTNVLARNSAASVTAKIDATTAGGTAGGLVGSASGTIIGCYSGGHTKNGSYKEWVKNNAHPYDVTGGTAGGLVGTSTAAINDSYSTCSVSGTTAGGFAGGATSGSITNCYATGLVTGAGTSTTTFAFVASGSPTLSGNYYYEAINVVTNNGKTEPMLPVSGYVLNKENVEKIRPIDLNAATYNEFVGSMDDWNPARAFDAALVKYYNGKYTLKSVRKLTSSGTPPTGYDWNQLFVMTHYGDWPAPEVFVINTPS